MDEARNPMTPSESPSPDLQARQCKTCERLQAKIALNERDHLRTIDERDRFQEWADKLAYAVASQDEIGEHTSANNPWANALEILESREAASSRPPSPSPCRCASIAQAEAVWCAERMVAADERGDTKTADMLEAQVVAASRIEAALPSSPSPQEAGR